MPDRRASVDVPPSLSAEQFRSLNICFRAVRVAGVGRKRLR